jgi:hypothetical protein
MSNEYEDPPIGTRRGRVSTWIALVLIALVLGFIVWYSIGNWRMDDGEHGSLPFPARLA